jgi:hypothetical protein
MLVEGACDDAEGVGSGRGKPIANGNYITEYNSYLEF